MAKCNDYKDVAGDNKPFDPEPWLSLGVPTAFWGGNYFADKLPISSGWLVWDKERPDGLDQATCELAWTNYVKGVRRFTHLWNGMMRASEHGENYHPTQKPVALQAWVLSLPWTPQGTILDPYMGSGTTGIACIRTGRKFIGIEIDPGYFQIACDRIRRELQQTTLAL
jgi:site-specific DNA-methyltransferase (adenine-specific)/modification methylase